MKRAPDGSVTLDADEAAIVRAALRCYAVAVVGGDVGANARRLKLDGGLAAWLRADTLRAMMEVTP